MNIMQTNSNNTVSNDGDTMKKSFIKKIRTMLETQKQEIEKRIENNIRHGEIDEGAAEDVDLVQARILALASKQLEERDRLSVKKIEGAIQRIEENRFGVCAQCEDEIDEKRLLFSPYLCLCIVCAEKSELRKKQGL